jgi:hypothetical protein
MSDARILLKSVSKNKSFIYNFAAAKDNKVRQKLLADSTEKQSDALITFMRNISVGNFKPAENDITKKEYKSFNEAYKKIVGKSVKKKTKAGFKRKKSNLKKQLNGYIKAVRKYTPILLSCIFGLYSSVYDNVLVDDDNSNSQDGFDSDNKASSNESISPTTSSNSGT